MDPAEHAIVCDLDGTLIVPATRLASRYLLASFQTYMSQSSFSAYATGRTYALAREGAAEYALPEPDFWICELATKIYDRLGSELETPLKDADRTCFTAIRENALALGSYRVEEHQYRIAVRFGQGQRDVANALAREVVALWNVRAVFTEPDSSHGVSVDFVVDNWDKWCEVDWINQRRPASSRVIYFGDAENDLLCLEKACIPILMPNCNASVERALGQKISKAPKEGLSGVVEALRCIQRTK